MKKKIAIIGILLLLISFVTFNFASVRADSGWDSDYDFGGSDWDSDWGSSDWDSSSGSYSGDGSAGVVLFWIILFIIILIIVINKDNKTGRIHYQGNSSIDKNVDEEEIKKYIPTFNKEEFLNQAYDTFINVQNAWSEFDYEKLRALLTDELYNTYHSQLVALNAKKQKNIMSDFEKIKMDISDIKVDGSKISLTVSLIVRFHDYVVDKNDNVVRGNKSTRMQNSYDLTFISTLSSKGKKKKKQKNCPSCGAPLKNTSSNVCPYCGSNVVFSDYDWILSKKEIRRFH